MATIYLHFIFSLDLPVYAISESRALTGSAVRYGGKPGRASFPLFRWEFDGWNLLAPHLTSFTDKGKCCPLPRIGVFEFCGLHRFL